jgi:RNase P subunit RPR2
MITLAFAFTCDNCKTYQMQKKRYRRVADIRPKGNDPIKVLARCQKCGHEQELLLRTPD